VKRESDAAIAKALEAEAQAKREADEARDKAERAEREKNEAIEAERKRVAAEAQRQADEAAARERDTNHRRAINKAAVDALVTGGVPWSVAQDVIKLIAKKMIPAVTITY
jgi:hypothetical protein